LFVSYYDQVAEAAAAIRSRVPVVPEIAIVLGSGLGDFAHSLGEAVSLPYTTCHTGRRRGSSATLGRWSSARRTAGRSRRWPAAVICTKGMPPVA
jgi:purine nucleoside phosphorylase